MMIPFGVIFGRSGAISLGTRPLLVEGLVPRLWHIVFKDRLYINKR